MKHAVYNLLLKYYNSKMFRPSSGIVVIVGVGNDLLQLSSTLDFEGSDTSGNRILNFLHFSYDFFLTV